MLNNYKYYQLRLHHPQHTDDINPPLHIEEDEPTFASSFL
jgi:hypothetical protein